MGNTTTGTLYYGTPSIGGSGKRTYPSSPTMNIACPSVNPSISHAINVTPTAPQIDCKIDGEPGGFAFVVYNFNIVPCPLDDYIPFLFLAISAIALFHLHSRYKIDLI
ncbi:hypothetical protein [Pedobacter frigiditerrae]|uniref:hypothetical protein n=1 Tax=Pedobacter frigiditerrae TaxID=2530452 RepID=UPI00292CD16A|nr:hypothetical protein [Pedobacter frigiditerrae]